MRSEDLKTLLNRLNSYTRSKLEEAASVSVARTHYEVTVEQFLSTMMTDPIADIPLILKYYNSQTERWESQLNTIIEKFNTGNGAKPVFSPRLIEWLQEAFLDTTLSLEDSYIRSGTLFSALLGNPYRFVDLNGMELLNGISRDDVIKNFTRITKQSSENKKSASGSNSSSLNKEDNALSRYCENLIKKASEGKIDPVFGRDQEIRQIIDIFARRRKNNPILVGEAGVGKTAVVEGLALRIVNEDVPDFLRGVCLLTLDMGLLQAGAGMKGEFENRLKNIITEVKASTIPIILFIDEAHTMIGAGSTAGSSDAANLLKPALARGELRTIAATTWKEYKKYFEKDAALARRFQLIHLEEPSVMTTIRILRGLKSRYEENHNVVIQDQAICAMAEFSDRYISGRYLPDKAIDLLDTSAARVRVMQTGKPEIIEFNERQINILNREYDALKRDADHGAKIDGRQLKRIKTKIKEHSLNLKKLNIRWKKEQHLCQKIAEIRDSIVTTKSRNTDITNNKIDNQKDNHSELLNKQKKIRKELETIQDGNPMIIPQVDMDIISKVVSDWTGIPVGKMMHDQSDKILHLQSLLSKRIKGQDDALAEISRSIAASKAELTDPQKPMGIFFLCGPSGVGKTETGLALADELFGGQKFTVSINMSEFQEKHTVSRLIGSPPGYVGFGEGGILTETVRQRPYCVVLLDEVEKAHPDVMNLFYQVFDKGILNDGEGRKINFKNTIIIMTSNLGSEAITAISTSTDKIKKEDILDRIKPVLSQAFKPALLARMCIVPYLNLSDSVMNEIVILKMNQLTERMNRAHKIKLDYSEGVIKQIRSRCKEVDTGARNIDHIMNRTLFPHISEKLLISMGSGKTLKKLYLDITEKGEITINGSKNTQVKD